MLNWHFFLSPVSFSFLRMNLSTSDFRVSHLLADGRPLTLFPSRQCSMLQSAAINIGHKVHFNALSHLPRCNKCDCESFHQVCLYMLWCGNIVLWSITLFYVTIFTTLTPLGWFFFSCKYSFPFVGCKRSCVSNISSKSPNRIFVWYLGN